jgi:hypothetical protein
MPIPQTRTPRICEIEIETPNGSKRENAMNIRARLLAGLMGSALIAGSAFAAATSDSSLVTAARQGDRAAVQAALKGLSKQEITGQQGTAALAWAATRNDLQLATFSLAQAPTRRPPTNSVHRRFMRPRNMPIPR